MSTAHRAGWERQAVPEQPAPIALGKGALWTHRLRGRPLRVRCTAGSVWVTHEGDPGDVVLRAGASYGGAGRGLLVVEALEEAQIAVTASNFREALRGAVGALRAHWLVVLSLAALYLIWGSTYLAMRIGLETMPPFLMAGGRFLIAGTALYAALRLSGTPAPTRREWDAATRTGVPLLVGGNGFLVIAQQWVDSGVAAVIVSTMPLWVALIMTVTSVAARRAGRGSKGDALAETSRGEWIGLLVGFAGAALLHLDSQLHVEHAGALLVFLSPLAWAIGSIWSRTLPLPKGPMATAAQMLVAGVSMLALSPILGERLTAAPSARSLAALAYLIVFGSIVAFSAYGFLIRSTRPAIATSYAYVNPLVAIALGIWFGGERASAVTWMAATIVIAGVVILSRARTARVSPGASR